jgi:hypothetical protein
MTEKCDEKTGRDFISDFRQGEDGSITCLRHHPDNTVRVNTLLTVKEGMSLAGSQLIQIQRVNEDNTIDVGVVYDGTDKTKEPTPEQKTLNGPAKVNSKAYRDNWSNIFGSKNNHSQLN